MLVQPVVLQSPYTMPSHNKSHQEKRTTVNRPLVEKLRAIERVMKGESRANVSADMGLPEATLRGWIKDTCKLYAKQAEIVRLQSKNEDSLSDAFPSDRSESSVDHSSWEAAVESTSPCSTSEAINSYSFCSSNDKKLLSKNDVRRKTQRRKTSVTPVTTSPGLISRGKTIELKTTLFCQLIKAESSFDFLLAAASAALLQENEFPNSIEP